MAKDESTAVATSEAEQLEAAYGAILDGKELPATVAADPELISRQIVEGILNAETFEEAFAPKSVPAWRDMLDVPVLVRNVKLNRSSFEGSASSIYAVCDLTRIDSGEQVTVTCGGRNVLAQLVKMLEKGWTDKPVKLIGKQTAEGYTALWLQAA